MARNGATRVVVEFSEQMLRALEDTIYAYDLAIADLENGEQVEMVLGRWDSYGQASSCRFCVAAVIDFRHLLCSFDCKKCLLGPKDRACVTPTFKKLQSLVSPTYGFPPCGTRDSLLKAFKARRNYIIRKAAQRGIVLEDGDA